MVTHSASAMATVPVALLLGYGGARLATSFFSEVRSAVFTKVVQSAIRKMSKEVRGGWFLFAQLISSLLFTRPSDVSSHSAP